MADNILKLKVESSEYDAKLKKAAEGIRHLADVAHQGGGELTGLEKAELDYVKALGEMDTKSRTAAGSVRELESSYKELKVIYDQLNEVEKADEGGKALAASLEQIKQRAQEAKAQLESASQSLSDNGQQAQQSSGILDALASKFTLNIDALKLFDMGLSAVNMALDVAKDAFMSSEANVDEWGRVIDSSKSLYEGFLTALNTGDISGYLGRIDEIVQAARTAYNELDRLGTMKTIQAPKMSAQQTENERMRMMIQTGRYIAPVDGRKASMQNGQLLTPDQIKRIEQQLQGGMQKVVTLVGNEVAQTGRAIDAVYNRQAQELGMSLKEFRKGTSSMAEFDKRMAGYDQYQKWREQHTTIDLQSGRETVARGNPFEQFAKWGTFRVDGQRYNDLIRLIQQRDQQASQAYNTQSQAYRAINRAEGITVKGIMKGESGGGGGGRTPAVSKEDLQREKMFAQLRKAEAQASKIIADERAKEHRTETRGTSGFNEQNIANWTSMMKDQLSKADFGSVMYNQIVENMKDMSVITELTKEAVKRGFSPNELGLTDLFEQAFDNIDVDDNAIQGIIDKINEVFKNNPIELNVKTGGKDGIKPISDEVKKLVKTANITADVVGSIGDAFNAIEDPAAKVAGTVAQAIATVAAGYAQATLAAAQTGNPWVWVAFAASGLAQMLTMISTIHSATGYAQGGIVKGNSYSGDNIYGGPDAMVNAGELVLTRAQQANLASNLEGSGGGFRDGQIIATIKGETIVLSAKRWKQRTGRSGENVSFKI